MSPSQGCGASCQPSRVTVIRAAHYNPFPRGVLPSLSHFTVWESYPRSLSSLLIQYHFSGFSSRTLDTNPLTPNPGQNVVPTALPVSVTHLQPHSTGFLGTQSRTGGPGPCARRGPALPSRRRPELRAAAVQFSGWSRLSVK